MYLVTFRKINGSYRRWKKNSAYLEPLEWFLTDCTGGIYALNCLDDPKCKRSAGNSYYLTLSDNDVTIGLLFFEDNPREIVFKKDNLKNIIKNWEKLKAKNVDEIVIKSDRNILYIIGRYLSPEEKKVQQQALEEFSRMPSIGYLIHNLEKVKQFEEKWQVITPDEAKELEYAFFEELKND